MARDSLNCRKSHLFFAAAAAATAANDATSTIFIPPACLVDKDACSGKRSAMIALSTFASCPVSMNSYRFAALPTATHRQSTARGKCKCHGFDLKHNALKAKEESTRRACTAMYLSTAVAF
eukprot:CAMPEP_0171680862 /NCGR_PEP_ID=MMETSP0990-20121206/57060_1 /TAXON_ID=483369 /ORGANISM="non described non described, Strain CCMP2098" /LENGTH=120 /DNA_ID=CAMNT_0012267869 /DNA_START=238 /DNA_END=601 /DNA_ORIENTATION=-